VRRRRGTNTIGGWGGGRSLFHKRFSTSTWKTAHPATVRHGCPISPPTPLHQSQSINHTPAALAPQTSRQHRRPRRCNTVSAIYPLCTWGSHARIGPRTTCDTEQSTAELVRKRCHPHAEGRVRCLEGVLPSGWERDVKGAYLHRCQRQGRSHRHGSAGSRADDDLMRRGDAAGRHSSSFRTPS